MVAVFAASVDVASFASAIARAHTDGRERVVVVDHQGRVLIAADSSTRDASLAWHGKEFGKTPTGPG